MFCLPCDRLLHPVRISSRPQPGTHQRNDQICLCIDNDRSQTMRLPPTNLPHTTLRMTFALFAIYPHQTIYKSNCEAKLNILFHCHCVYLRWCKRSIMVWDVTLPQTFPLLIFTKRLQRWLICASSFIPRHHGRCSSALETSCWSNGMDTCPEI